MKRIALILAGVLVIIAGLAIAQQKTATQLEDSATKTGTIIIKDFYEVGIKKGKAMASKMEMRALVVYQFGAPDKRYGLEIFIDAGAPEPQYSNRSFLDFEEVISLSEALQYMLEQIGKEEKEYTEILFNTRDYFTIGFYQKKLKSTVFARSGGIYPAIISFRSSRETLEEIKAFVDKGLDKLRSLGAK